MGDVEEPIEDIEGTGEEEEQLETGGPRRKLFGPSVVRTLLYISAALVMIVISGTVAAIVAKRASVQPGGERTGPESAQKVKPYSNFELGEFSVNTSDPVEPHFIKVTIWLGYDEGAVELQSELVKRRPQLRDKVIQVIGEKQYEDLYTEDLRKQLRDDLRDAINSLLIDGRIHEVYFSDFVLT